MKIHLKNLGPLREAEFELSDLTIICGENNTGKTYATYALFGFLKFWREGYRMEIQRARLEELFREGSVQLNLTGLVERAQEIVTDSCRIYTKQLPIVFSAPEKRFSDSEFRVHLEPSETVVPTKPFDLTMGAARNQLFTIRKEEGAPIVTITLLVAANSLKVPREVVERAIAEALQEILFGHIFPKPFIASAERTGAAIFRKELNFSKRKMLEELHKTEEIDPFDLLFRLGNDYALPVESNVKFARSLESIGKRTSPLAKEHGAVLDEFSDIIGGRYEVTSNDELFFVQKRGGVKLSLDESSSAVRSLLDLGFYLRHQAETGDILMIDEPELNLHPKNQRKVARLLAKLANIGIKIFVTTHSDYFAKEINTLLLLGRDGSHTRKVRKTEKYSENELLHVDQVRVYMAKQAKRLLEGFKRQTTCQTLVRAPVDLDNGGLDISTFDDTIDEINRIQDAILWGDDE
jgi:hypothetical protein